MYDVILKSAVISDRQGVAQYTAQDLETQIIGPAVPFTYDFQFGMVSLGYDFITNSPSTFNGFDSQDMEALAIGVIASVPATALSPTGAAIPVQLLVGAINPAVASLGDDDMESYSVGGTTPITQLNNAISSGDIIMGIAFLRPFA